MRLDRPGLEMPGDQPAPWRAYLRVLLFSAFTTLGVVWLQSNSGAARLAVILTGVAMIAGGWGQVPSWRRWALRVATVVFTLALFGWQLDLAVAPSEDPFSRRRVAYLGATAMSGLVIFILRSLLDRDERRAQQRSEALAAARHQDLLDALTTRAVPRRRWPRRFLLAAVAIIGLLGGGRSR